MTLSEVFVFFGAILAVSFAAILAVRFWWSAPANYPPGPKGIPILGVMPKIDGNAHEAFFKWSKEYGNVYSIKLGPDDIIVLNGYDTIKEAMVTQSEIFCGRSYNFMDDIVFNDTKLGLSLIDGDHRWKDQRAFFIKALHEINPENKSIGRFVMKEVEFLIGALEKNIGKNVDHHDVVVKCFANLINQIVFGYRVDYSNRPLSHMITLSYDRFCNDPSMAKLFGIVGFFPALRFIAPFNGATDKVKELLSTLRSILKRQIDKKIKHFDNNKKVKCISEAFFKRMNDASLTPEERSFYTEEQLLHLCQDIVVGGVETSSAPLRWSFVFMLQNPEIQDKLYNEIRSVLGDEPLEFEHWNKLHYTRGFMEECRRLMPIISLGIPHKTKAPTKLAGFDIPSGHKIMTNIWGLHHDPVVWGDDVNMVRPERHLDEQGIFVKSPYVTMFSIGCRQCPGKDVATIAEDLVLARLVQYFKFSNLNPPNPKPITTDPLLVPGVFKVTLEKRNPIA